MIPDETFDDLRAVWDYSGGASGSYWHILKHAELGKFDLSAMKRSISERIAIFYSDLGYSIDDESERVIVLDLRDRMRTECLIAPLSMQERRDWMWVDIAPSRVYRQKPHSSDPSLRTNNIQNRAIASYLASRHPEAIRYIRSVRKHNRKLPGHNGGAITTNILSGSFGTVHSWRMPHAQSLAKQASMPLIGQPLRRSYLAQLPSALVER